MAKFMMTSKGQSPDMTSMSEEEQMAEGAKWGTWMQKIGSALAAIGSPFASGSSVSDNGSSGDAISLSGYSIVEAANLRATKALTSGHPYLSEGKETYSVELFELLPVPFEQQPHQTPALMRRASSEAEPPGQRCRLWSGSSVLR